MIGQTLLGKYKVNRQIDEGGMSKIYLARQIDQSREVVVKVLKGSLGTQPKAVEHFRREIYLMSRLDHPHVVAVHDSSTRDLRGPILVMEYLKGTDLNLVIQKAGRLPAERVARILGQLCSALQYIHDSGILHRDLKPGNIMMLNAGTPEESAKLMDFGLAKVSKMLYISPEEIGDVNACAASGTPEYISPEMVRGNEMDARSDLYSVGVMLYEMLAGRRPFHHADVEALMVAHAKEPPPRFADIGVTDVPAAVERVVMSCLAKYPDQRPASAQVLAEAFDAALGRRVMPTRPSSPGARLAPPPKAPTLAAAAPLEVDRNAVRHSMEANIPESMAMLKIKGFIFDLGAEVTESVPGLIKVKLREPEEKKGGFFGWRSGGSRQATALQTATGTDIELHMERRGGGPLTITLTMRPLGGMASAEWRTKCGQVARDLQAYILGR